MSSDAVDPVTPDPATAQLTSAPTAQPADLAQAGAETGAAAGRPAQQHRPARSLKIRHNWGWLIALVVLALLAAGGYGYYYWTNVNARDAWQTDLTSGDAVGLLKIPALGADFAVPIRPDTSPAMLRQGVGWYPGTTAPGQRGNFAVAGYRLGWGQPFYHLADLKPGDTIIVQAGGQTYTYSVVTGPITVSRDDTGILSAVPGDPGQTPTRALITLTTAQDLLPTADRTVVIGQLTG